MLGSPLLRLFLSLSCDRKPGQDHPGAFTGRGDGRYMEDSAPSLSRQCTCMHVKTPDSHFNNTIDLEITTDNHYSEHILVQHS